MSSLLPSAVMCTVLFVASASAQADDEPVVPPPPPTPTLDSSPALPTPPEAPAHPPSPRYEEPKPQAWPAPGYTALYDAGYHWYRPEAVVPGIHGCVHHRYPYYSYRRPWYPAGPASANVTIIW